MPTIEEVLEGLVRVSELQLEMAQQQNKLARIDDELYRKIYAMLSILTSRVMSEEDPTAWQLLKEIEDLIG